MFCISINSISVLHTYWMIPTEVDHVKANQYKKLFYLSFDPSADNDAATILSSFREMKETLNIRLPASPLATFHTRKLLGTTFQTRQQQPPTHIG